MFTGKPRIYYLKTTAYIRPGIVVENFSYVYQQEGTASLTREQMRAFKKAWAKFDLEGTGYLRRDKIGPFLAVHGSLGRSSI